MNWDGVTVEWEKGGGEWRRGEGEKGIGKRLDRDKGGETTSVYSTSRTWKGEGKRREEEKKREESEIDCPIYRSTRETFNE